MKNIVCFIVVLSIYTYVSAQVPDTQIMNCLNFVDIGTWKLDIARFDADSQIDSTVLYKGKYPMQIKQTSYSGFYAILRGGLYNIFPLPSVDSDSMSVSCTCKSQNLKRANLVISGISEREEILYSDTLSINGYEDWHTFHKEVSLRNVAMIKLSLGFTGIESGEFVKLRGEKKDGLQNLWIDRIEMKVNGKMIVDYYPVSRPACAPLSQNNVIVGDSLLSPIFESPFKSKKIVAFGESVHGSETINRKIIQLFRHGIENDDRRLILLELPLEKTLYLNRFVQGDIGFHVDNIKSYLEHTLYSDTAWTDFFIWLKEYNAGTKEKVWLLGIDHENEHLVTELDLFEYLTAINRTAPDYDITEFCKVLLKTRMKIEEKLLIFQSHDCFKNRLGSLESKIVEHCFQLIIQARSRPVLDFVLRDEMMFENLHFLYNHFSQKAVVYCHFGHACPSSIGIKPSLGFLAKRVFGDDYFVVGIFVGGGKTLNNGKKGLTLSLLRVNEIGTFEDWLSQVQRDEFYVSQVFLPSCLMRFREVGNLAIEVSGLMNPFCRMEGALFIKESKPLKKNLEKETDSFRFINRYKRCLDESRKVDFGRSPL
jgi:hypothetical protein